MPAPLCRAARLRAACKACAALAALLAASASALALSASAAADPFGQLGRLAINPSPYRITEGTAAFGVDASDKNAIYIGEEAPEVSNKEGGTEPSGSFRIQKFSEGLLVGETAKFNPKTNGAEPIEGVAIDHELGRIYVLALFERPQEPDEGEAAAGTLYAFKTSPAGKTLESAVAGEPAGVLASATVLKASAKKAGEALLNPTGIAVDPTNHQIVMLGEVDQGGASGRHLAVWRVSSGGELLPGYVDPGAAGEPEEANSPVISAAGTVLAQRNGAANEEQIIQIPGSGSPSRPASVFHFSLRASSQPIEELVEFDPEPERKGSGLALVPGEEGTGKLWSESEIYEQQLGPEGVIESKAPFAGALALNYTESAGKLTTTEAGWTGGQSEQAGLSAPCTIAEGTAPASAPIYPLLAAGSSGKVFLLSSKTLEVVEFGPGGSGCPHARVSGIIAAEGAGPPLAEVTTGAEINLSSEVASGNVLSVEWSFGDGTTPETLHSIEFQHTEATHVFKQKGTFTVTEKIKTDDLASPELEQTRVLVVVPPPPTAILSPPALSSPSSAAPAPSQAPLTPAARSGVLGFGSFRVGLLGASTLTVSPSGAVVVKLACLGASSCVGSLALRTLGVLSAGARKSVLTLASGSFSLPGGHSKALTLHLGAKARKLLERARVLRALARILARDAAGAMHSAQLGVTLRAAKRHH